MNPAEAIEAAELAERETAYRNQLARQMYEAGRRDAESDMAHRWAEVARPAAPVASATPNWRTAAGDRVAAPTSPTPGPATSPARPARPNRKRNRNWRPRCDLPATAGPAIPRAGHASSPA